METTIEIDLSDIIHELLSHISVDDALNGFEVDLEIPVRMSHRPKKEA
jgi:hypothetical protein